METLAVAEEQTRTKPLDSNMRSHISPEDAIGTSGDLSIDQTMVKKDNDTNLGRTSSTLFAHSTGAG